MRIFRKNDGGVVQLIDKEEMKEWPIELPLIFIEYIRTKQLDNYGSAKKDVEQYLDEIMTDVAIPRLVSVLEGDDNENILLALARIEEISKKDIEMAKPIEKYLDKLIDRNDKQIVKLAQNISNNFANAKRKEELAKRRKTMREKEKLFLEGKISGEEYAKTRKEYLTLKE